MSKSLKFSIASFVVATLVALPVNAGQFGLGRPALPDEIAAWDLDVRPDGLGLPAGSGSVEDGENVFADQCASCHGDFAEGVDNWPKLAGGAGTLDHEDPLKTVGSYWPYLSTTWDYVNRSMPFGNAQTLEADDVYAIVAYILYSNDLVDDDFVLSDETFLDVEMPNVDGFILDDRAAAEYSAFSQDPCMENCKSTVEITKRAAVLDVTPQETPAVSTQDTEVALTSEESAAVATVDPELLAAGEKAFKKCKACHQVGEGAKNKTGPHLNSVMGRVVGSLEGFRYSKGFKTAGADGLVWNAETLAEFLTKPRAYIKGTKMTFAGFKKQADIDAVTAYLESFQE